MPYDKIDQLYDALKADGAVSKSRENFRSKMLAPGKEGYENRLQLYKALKADGAVESPTYEDFGKRLGLHAANQRTQSVPAAASSNAPAKVEQKAKTAGTPMTDADKQQMIAGANDIVAQAGASLQQTQKRMDYARANTGLNVPKTRLGVKGDGVKLGQNAKVTTKNTGWDTETGKPEETFVTESGNEYRERGAADMEQNAVDAARYENEQQEAYLLREKARIEGEMAEHGRRMDNESANSGSPWGGAIAMGRRATDSTYQALEAQKRQVDDALATLAEAKKGKASDAWIDDSGNWAAKKGKEALAFGAGAWRGLAHSVGKVSTWDMGASDVRNNAALLAAAKNAEEKGIENISQEERDLLDMAAYSNKVQGDNAKYIGHGYKAGEVTGESLPFMVEMILNPASGLGASAANRMMREAVKRFGKDAVKKEAKKYVAAKIGTRVAGDALGSAAMAATTGQGHVTADMLKRMTGDVGFAMDESGKVVYGGRADAEDNALKAYTKAFGAQTIENHSEMLGEYFGPLLKGGAKLATKGLEKVGLGSVNRFISGVGATNAAKIVGDFEKKAKWNGTIGEYAEEVAGNIENALLVGDNTLDAADDTGVFNKEQNLDTFLGVALMGGFFSAVKTASYRGPKREALNEMSRAGKVMDEALSGNYAMREKWGEWRNRLLVGTDEEKKATLREVMDDTELPMNVRMGVLNFSKAAQKYEGIARAQESKVNEGEQDPVAREYDASYDKGYEATGTQDMNDVRMSLDMKRAQLAQALGMENADDVDAVVGDPLQYVQSKTGDMNVIQRTAAVDYANAKSAYDGMAARINDDADDMAEQKRETARKMEHADGMIRPAVMKETDDEGHNKVMYVVDGTVVMTDDGSMVDKTKSDNSVVVYNPETGKRQIIDPGADTGILSLGATTSAADYDAMIERDREQYVQEQMDEAQGKVRLVPGMQIVLPTGEPAVVMAMDGDNVTVGLGDGKQTSAQLSDLQRISDEKALADYNQRHGIEPEQDGEQAQGEGQGQEEAPTLSQETTQGDAAQGGVVAGAPAEFAPDMELTVRDESGTEKPAMVMGRVRYENGSFVPDENGSIIEYYVDGEVKHDHEDKLRDKVVNHVVAEPDGNSLPQYGVNDTFTLRDAEGNAVSGEVQGISEDGVEIRTDAPVNGKRVQVIPADVFENMVETLHDADGNTVWERNPAVGENGESVPETGMNVPENAPENGTNGADKADIGKTDMADNGVDGKADMADGADNAVGETAGNDMEGNAGEADAVRPMPMLDNGEEDWHSATPERAHQYIYNEAGLSRSEGNQFVSANVDAAQKALSKAKAAQMPLVGTSIQKYNQAKAKRQEKIDEAQREVDYWNGVRDIQNGIQKEENERRAAADAVRHDEAVAQAQADYETRKNAEAERKAVGNENPMPAIADKWDNAPKVDGHKDEIMLPDGTPLKGHYVLHESGASSPSHNPQTWQKTEGFPMDANDNSVNDRDYERDHDAQEHTERIAEHYDQRALQNVPVVSNDGVVLSGNGRTMAGELAAQNNTDGAYVNYLKEYAHKWGFTTEQVEDMEHPRVSFVPDEAMPYTAETFAKFNQQEMKSQNKTEQAVKLGKTVSDESFKQIVRTINGFDTLGDFYNDADASLGAVYDLQNAGVVAQAQLAEMVDGVRGQERLSAVGREFLENMLIGKAFGSDPDVVRMLTAEPAMRQSVITALGEIADNIALGTDWSVQKELSDAVRLCFDARNDGAKYGEIVSTYARQGVLFADPDELQMAADFDNATMLMLADVLNDKRVTLLKATLQLYNNDARQSASGQTDLFAGGVKSREDILNNVVNYINENYGKRKELEAARAAAVERRKADRKFDGSEKKPESVQQDGVDATSGGEDEAETNVQGKSDGRVSETYKGLSDGEADELLSHMEAATSEIPQLELNPDNWIEQFGEDGKVVTPMGEVKMGENQIAKLFEKGRSEQFGMIKPTLEHPQAIIEVPSEATDGNTERASSLLFVKTFKKADGTKVYYFKSVTVKKDGLEVSVSSHYDRAKRIKEALKKGKLLYRFDGGAQTERHPADVSVTTSPESLQGKEGNTLQTAASQPHGGVSSLRKSNQSSPTVQGNSEKSSEKEGEKALSEKIREASGDVNTEPTEAQKEAGNYKKGHVQVGTFDITIEQPEGSVRRGTDADGHKWESKMHNTYGYFKGTEGVDGDHIDVFLSTDIDGWNGRKVYVVDQYNPDGSFDEHKVMLGFNDADEAKGDYLANYENGWEKGRRIDVSEVNLEDFEKWIESSHRKTKPFSEYAGVKMVTEADGATEPDGANRSDKADKGAADKTTESDGANRSDKADKGATGKTDKADVIPANPEVQGHDWSQYKKGDVFDYDGYKSRYLFTEKENDGRVTGVTVEHLDDNGNAVGRESVPPLMFVEHYKKVGDAEQPKTVREQKADGVKALSGRERVLRDGVVDRMLDAGLDVSMDTENGQRVLDEANGDVRMEAKHHSESAEKRRRVLGVVDEATAFVTGKDIKDVRAERMAREAEYKAETRDLYEKVLSGKFDDVTLQRINEYLDHVTPNNEYGRPLSKRLPPEVVRRVRKGERTSEIDVLFSRISESAVPANERTRAEGKRRIEEKKKELLKGWAIATGNWHTSVEDFTHDTEPIGSGKDSVVYQSDDGKSVIKVSAGKDNVKKFRPDIDAVTLFNHIFRNSPYEILGYGEIGGKFVKFLKQPIVDFSDSTPLSADERVAYMERMGFKPMNDEKTAFSNGKFVVADLQGNNIVKDKAGNIRVIDADVKLHTKDAGGSYEYPAVETDFPTDTGISYHRVYHGSGADFDHFDHSHMGEGEGAQVYGWGTYVTEVEGIGRTYARASNQSTLRKEKLKSDISRAKERLPFMKGEYKTALEEEIAQKEEELSKISDANHHLYTVEIPDDNGSNYLDWTKEYSENDVYSIVDRLLDVAAAKEKDGNLDDYEKNRDAADHIAEWVDGNLENDFFDKLTGENIYRKVAGSFEDYSEEEASKLLSEAGFTGIKYPAENMRGGRADGAKDYVIFNESDAQITDHIRFFRTANGEAYGFTVGGKIYIDPRIAGSDTAIHEYAHLWASALRACNPEEWKNVVALMKGTPIWDEVKERYADLKTDDEIADEVLAHYSGRRGAERLREEARKIADGNGGVFEKAEAISALERVKRALDAFWKGVCDFLHIHYTSAEEVADRVMKDLLDGVDPRKFGKTDGKLMKQEDAEMKEVVAKAKAEGTYMKAPNGARSKLSPRQWTQVRTSAFKEWFGDWENDAEHASKVVDENGEPRVVYHGTNNKFSAFDPNMIGTKTNNKGIFGNGFYFTKSEKLAKDYDWSEDKSGDVMPVFVNVRNPFVWSDSSAENIELARLMGFPANRSNRGKLYPLVEEEQIMAFTTKLKDAGYDGVVYNYDNEHDETIAFYPNQIKSATDNVGTFDAENNDIRYQFVGEKGASAADHAEEVTTRVDNLQVAREMEAAKKDAKAIKMATGWERGADGMWRYEIPDIDFIATGDANFAKIRERQPWVKELDALCDKLFDEEQLSETEQKRFDELAKLDNELYDTYKKADVKYLDDYVRADELMKAYPELKQVKVAFVDAAYDWAGKYSKDENTIYLNIHSSLGAHSILAHEIQHAIQDMEGFAKGGNTESVRRVIEDIIDDNSELAERFVVAMTTVSELNSLLYRLDNEYRDLINSDEEWARDIAVDDYFAALNAIGNGAYDDGNGSLHNDFGPFNKKKMSPYDIAKTGYHVDETVKELKRLAEVWKGTIDPEDGKVKDMVWKLKNALNAKTDSELYRALAGEVEARNVQSRLGMSAEERRKSLASETEDVSREDQIFLYGEGGESHMGTRTNKHMAEIGKYYEGKDLSDNVRTIIDVFSGKQDKPIVAFTNKDGEKHQMVMIQGQDFKAGSKHAIYRHYGEKQGWFDIDEITKIYDVLTLGERSDEKGNIAYTYTDKENGVEYTVIAKRYKGKERFVSFYTNRKAPNSGLQKTQQGAHANLSDASDGAKVERNSETASKVEEKGADDGLKFRLLDENGEENLSPNYAMPPREIDEQHYVPYVGGMHLNTALRWLREHPVRVSYREVFTKPTLEDYYVDTRATFEAVDVDGKDVDAVWQEMKASGKYEWHQSPKSDSEYLIDYKTGDIYRKADHWGRVASCEWSLRDNGSGKLMDKKSYAIGRANISDFNGIKESRAYYTPANDRLRYVENPWVEDYKKELKQSIVNYDDAMRNVAMTDGARERMGKAKARLEELLKLTDERQKIVENGIMLRDGEENAEMNDKAQRGMPMTPEAKRAEAERLGEKLNTRLNIIEDPNAIVHDDPKVQARRRKAKGWYDTRTGEVTVVLPNNMNVEDVAETVFHEVVGHKGLRELIGEKGYGDFLREVYEHAKADVRRRIAKIAAKHGWDFEKATDEYLSGLAEKGFEDFDREERSMWQWLKEKVVKAIDKFLQSLKLPKWVKLGDNELRYMLWRSKERLERGKEDIVDMARDIVKREELGLSEAARYKMGDANEELDIVNERFNHELTRYQNGEMDKNEMLHLGRPQGVMRAFLPNLPIVMRQRVIKKGSEKKHEVDVSAIMNMPQHLSSPIFVFQRSEDTIGVLTDMRDRNGKNVCVAIELKRQIQQGAEYLEVNDVRSFHGREFKNIVEPIANNKTLKWVDKGKGLAYLSSASQPVQQEIDKQVLDTATKVVKNFVNPDIPDENVADEDIMYRDGDSEEYEKALARDIYEQRVSRGMYQTQEALQDSMLGLKEAMDAVLQAEGRKMRIEDVAGYENAYLGENRLSSVNQAECTAFAQTLFKPMLKEVSRLAKSADERAELTDYMMAKHGLERNEVMARRAAEKKANEEFGADIRKAERAVNKNPLDQDAIDTLDDLRQQRDDREQNLYFENRGKDYSGLTALTGTDNVADAEAEAQRMVADYENAHHTDGLWDKVNAVTGATLLKTYESGLINKATYDDIKGMYTHYIPLRGFDDKTSDEAYAYLADEHSAFNAPIKTAKGRKSKADDPFANMEAMAESAIMQGNRNTLVKQKFLNFALNHPSDLVSVSNLWLRYDDVKDEWMPVNSGDIAGTERLEEDDSPAEVERKMRDFEDAMGQAAKNDPAHFKKQKDDPAIPYRVVESRDLRQHQVLVKRNGKDYILTINGNPRAAQALNGQTNPDNDISGAIGAIMHMGEAVNRQLSAFYTTRNPDFVVSNFMRDMLYANTIVWVKESPNYAVRFHKNVAKANPAMMKMLLAKLRNGTLDMNDKTENMFYQFMMNGGETGYANIRDIEQRKNDIKRELKKNNGKLPIRKAWDYLGERLDEYNRAVENCARFAAFMTSRELGRTIDRSIWDAKEISVNFNKKGSGAKFMGANGQTKAGNAAAFTSGLGRSFYVFWNAAIQGTTNFGRQAKRHPKKAIAGAATMFLLGALMAGLGDGDGDDDHRNDYYNLPEYVRRSNIVFRLPGMDKQWISIPLPVEYRAMYGMGELAVSAMSGNEHYVGGELAHAMASQVSQMLPLDFLEGGGGFKTFIPSSVKPMAEVLTNESWTGMPIYKDNPYNKDMPEWTKAYKSANKYLVGLSKTMNEATGGDAYTSGTIDINPAQVEYLLNGVFGGMSSTVDKLTKMGETVVGEREYDPRSFLLLNRVVKSGDERTEYRAVNNAYFKIKEESEKLRKRLNHYENDTADGIFDYAEKIAWLNNSPEYRILETYEEYSGDIDGINEELKDPTLRDDERNELEAELNQVKKDLVDAVNAMRNGMQPNR